MAGIVYRLLIAEPQTHHFLVDVEADGVEGPQRLVMPSWTPGSYLMREFPRNVVTFAAADGSGRPLGFAKTDKNTWRVDAPADGKLRVRYLVYADELSVRTSHVDASHAFINGTSAFMYLDGRQGEGARLEVRAPQGWRITTALEETAPGVFRAEDYDRLADAPLEIGTHDLFELDVDGVPHRWAVWGRGNLDRERLIADTARIVRAEQALFGELPYERFTFILHLLPGGSGGLEHRDSTVLVADRFAFRGPAYESFLGLVAHELFHAWNGKRIRPAVLGPFDYVRESYTRELWVVEGITTYYTDLVLRRAGIITPQRYLEKVAEQVARLATIPGRMVQPLEDASFDAWIKFYRPDANSPNATVSYYHKGGLVALLLDLAIREATGGARSLDDVMRALWAEYGRPDAGFPERRVEEVACEVAGADLKPFFDRWLRSTQELDFASVLAAFGLALAPAHEPRPGAPAPPPPTGEPGAQQMREVKVGFQFKLEAGKTIIGNVMAGTPAWRAGVSHGDELVALDGLRVDAMSLGFRMQEKAPGSTAILTVFRRDELINLAMQVESGPPARLAIHPKPEATPEQQALLQHWLREDPPRDPE